MKREEFKQKSILIIPCHLYLPLANIGWEPFHKNIGEASFTFASTKTISNKYGKEKPRMQNILFQEKITLSKKGKAKTVIEFVESQVRIRVLSRSPLEMW